MNLKWNHLGINLLSLRKGNEDFNKANEGCLAPVHLFDNATTRAAN
jgi:hypothetical protein